MGDDVWYFAYGSNLDPTRKERRTGQIREELDDKPKRVRLQNYCFAFNKIKDEVKRLGMQT